MRLQSFERRPSPADSGNDSQRNMAEVYARGVVLALGLHGVSGLNPKDANILAKRKLETAAKHDTFDDG